MVTSFVKHDISIKYREFDAKLQAAIKK